MKKRVFRRVVVMGSLGIMVGGLATAALQQASARAAEQRQPVEVKVDATPPNRSANLSASYADVLERATPAVVNIFTTRTIRQSGMPGMSPFFEDPMFRRFFGDRFRGVPRQPDLQQRSLGSGVIVSEDGYILTNDHVVDGADEIRVTRGDSREEYEAEVVGRDPRTDVAVLKIKGTDLPHATFADSDHVKVGDVVLAVGNPFGLGQTVTMGIVSATGRGGMGIEEYEDFIQTDAAINPGNSGGALIDSQGRLLGINTAILSQSGGNHGVGFAIPANLARSVMDQLIESGEVSRGFLGVGIQDLSPELAEEFGLEKAEGVLVTQVTPESAADKAGIQSGDVILSLNGRTTPDVRTLRLTVGKEAPGTKVKVSYLRDKRERTVTVTLQEMPGQETAKLGGLRQGDSMLQADTGALQGVAVGDLDRRTRQQFQVPDEIQGAIVTDVNPESASWKAGLRPGDVIRSIDRREVSSADEALQICREKRGDGRTLLRLWREGSYRYVVVKE